MLVLKIVDFEQNEWIGGNDQGEGGIAPGQIA